MLVLIADSGSTKTDWILLQNSKILYRGKTIGFNPYFHSKEQISAEINTHLKPYLTEYLDQIKKVFYYGTGCSNSQNCTLVAQAIQDSLGLSNAFVSHDLLAAARALCKNEWGIAAILGTGSNSCLYNGSEILENVPSTGYLWSDYGAGSQIGKYFIRDYFEDVLPSDLKKKFETEGYNREVILNNVYKSDIPSRYLAGVSLFISKHIDHPHVIKVLEECFDSFFKQQISKYNNSHSYKIHLVGSVAFHYKSFIAAVAKKHGYELGKVVQSPLEGLIEFHSNY